MEPLLKRAAEFAAPLSLSINDTSICVGGRKYDIEAATAELTLLFHEIRDAPEHLDARAHACQLFRESTFRCLGRFSEEEKGSRWGVSMAKLIQKSFQLERECHDDKECIESAIRGFENQHFRPTVDTLALHVWYLCFNRAPFFSEDLGAFPSVSLNLLCEGIKAYQLTYDVDLRSIEGELEGAREIALAVDALGSQLSREQLLSELALRIVRKLNEARSSKVLIASGYNYWQQPFGHTVYFEIGSDQTTGKRVIKVIDPLGPDGESEGCELIYSDCDPSDLGVRFWKNLLLLEISDRMMYRDARKGFYGVLHKFFGKKPIQRGRAFSLQGSSHRCTVKGAMVWLHGRMEERELRRFRSFYTAFRLNQLKAMSLADVPHSEKLLFDLDRVAKHRAARVKDGLSD